MDRIKAPLLSIAVSLFILFLSSSSVALSYAEIRTMDKTTIAPGTEISLPDLSKPEAPYTSKSDIFYYRPCKSALYFYTILDGESEKYRIIYCPDSNAKKGFIVADKGIKADGFLKSTTYSGRYIIYLDDKGSLYYIDMATGVSKLLASDYYASDYTSMFASDFGTGYFILEPIDNWDWNSMSKESYEKAKKMNYVFDPKTGKRIMVIPGFRISFLLTYKNYFYYQNSIYYKESEQVYVYNCKIMKRKIGDSNTNGNKAVLDLGDGEIRNNPSVLFKNKCILSTSLDLLITNLDTDKTILHVPERCIYTLDMPNSKMYYVTESTKVYCYDFKSNKNSFMCDLKSKNGSDFLVGGSEASIKIEKGNLIIDIPIPNGQLPHWGETLYSVNIKTGKFRILYHRDSE